MHAWCLRTGCHPSKALRLSSPPGALSARRHSRPCPRKRPGPLAALLKELPAEAATAAADQYGWQESRAVLEKMGLGSDEADLVLADAFGWGSQSYWRQQKVQQPPNAEHVQQVLEFLGGLGISEADLVKLVREFPQVLGCELALLQDNVKTLQARWFLKGRVLANTIVRKPQALGSTVDCGELGGCIAECNRCWARF